MQQISFKRSTETSEMVKRQMVKLIVYLLLEELLLAELLESLRF